MYRESETGPGQPGEGYPGPYAPEDKSDRMSAELLNGRRIEIDTYHFHRDPKELTDWRLDEAESQAMTAYRNAREAAGEDFRNFVVVVPVARAFLDDRNVVTEDMARTIEKAANEAVLDAVLAARAR